MRYKITCHLRLREQHTGAVLAKKLSIDVLADAGETIRLEIVLRNTELDYAILQSTEPRVSLSLLTRAPENLEGSELVLAFEVGVPLLEDRLGYSPATSVISKIDHYLIYECPVYGGTPGAAFLLSGGRLVGLHHETVLMVRDRAARKQSLSLPLDELEKYVGTLSARCLTRGWHVALLASNFADH